jgi:gliding motility-associated lipoprotein GldD
MHIPSFFKKITLAVGVLAVTFAACESDTFVPKPRAYPRVDYPERAYQPFSQSMCGFTFEQPTYMRFERDSTFFDEKAKSECWFTLEAPALNAQVHCSYYPVTGRARFEELVADAFELAQKHNIKANFIAEVPISRPQDRVYGMVFEIDGATASSYQFYLTDSTQHFLRGALYFKSQTVPDSMAPVLKFVKHDVNHLIETLRWGHVQ